MPLVATFDDLFADIKDRQTQRQALLRQGAWPAPPADLDAEQQQTWHDIAHEAYRQGLDPRLALAAAHAEGSDTSRFRHWGNGHVVTSPANAFGTMQVLRSTAADYGLDPTDYQQNIQAGVRKLKQVHTLYPNDPHLAFASYNAGEGTVRAAGGLPQNTETPQYVRRAMAFLRGVLTPTSAEAAEPGKRTFDDLFSTSPPQQPVPTRQGPPLSFDDLFAQPPPQAPVSSLSAPSAPVPQASELDTPAEAAARAEAETRASAGMEGPGNPLMQLPTLRRPGPFGRSGPGAYRRGTQLIPEPPAGPEILNLPVLAESEATMAAGKLPAQLPPPTAGIYEALFGSPGGGTETRRFSALSADDALSKAQAIRADAGEAITGIQSIHLISTGVDNAPPLARSSPEQETLLSAHLDDAKRWLAAILQPAPAAPTLTPTPQAPPAAPPFPPSGQLLFGQPTPQPATIFRNGKLVPNPDYRPLLPGQGDFAPPYGPQSVEGLRQTGSHVFEHLGQIPEALTALIPLLFPSKIRPDWETSYGREVNTAPNAFTAAMDSLSQQLAVDPRILLQHDTFADHLIRALSGAGIAIPEAVLATMLGGPVGGLTGLGILSGLKHGDAAALTEAARMAILGKLLTYARTMPMALRVPFTSALFGGTAASTGASLEDSFIQALIGAGLAIPGATPGRGVMTQIRGLGDWWRGGGAPPEAPVPPEGAPPTAPSGGGISRTMLLRGFALEQQGASLPDIAKALSSEFGVPANAAYAGAKHIRRTYAAALQSLSQQLPANTNESPLPPLPEIQPEAPNPLPDFPRYPHGEGRLGTVKVGAEALHPAEAEDILARYDSTVQQYREAATAATDPVQQQQLTLATDHYTEAARPYRQALEQWAQRYPDEAAFLDRKSTRLNSSHIQKSRMPSSA